MKYCSKCGQIADDDARYCKKCGVSFFGKSGEYDESKRYNNDKCDSGCNNSGYDNYNSYDGCNDNKSGGNSNSNSNSNINNDNNNGNSVDINVPTIDELDFDVEFNDDGTVNLDYFENVQLELWSVIGDSDKSTLVSLIKEFNIEYSGIT